MNMIKTQFKKSSKNKNIFKNKKEQRGLKLMSASVSDFALIRPGFIYIYICDCIYKILNKEIPSKDKKRKRSRTDKCVECGWPWLG